METLKMTDEEKLALIRQRIAVVEKRQGKADPVLAAFPLGRVGGSGPNVARLNASRSVAIEKTVDDAVLWRKLKDEEARLLGRIREASPEAQAAAADKAARDLALADRADAILRALPVGSPVESQFGTGVILRHNRKGATVQFSLFKESVPYRQLWLKPEQFAAAIAAQKLAD